MKNSKVSVVLITRNEEKSIRPVIQNIKKNLKEAEVVVVDSSTDKTPDIARKVGAKVIRQFPAKGYGPAMEVALLTPKSDIIITIDGDNTYPATALPKLVAKIEQGYDVVGASRFLFGKPKYLSWPNFLVNMVFGWFASLIFLKKISDLHSGMRAYKREVLHKIKWGERGYVLPGLAFIKSGRRGHAFPVELLLKPLNREFKVVEIPINYDPRLGVSKLDKFNATLWTFLRIINSRMS